LELRARIYEHEKCNLFHFSRFLPYYSAISLYFKYVSDKYCSLFVQLVTEKSFKILKPV